MLDIRIDGYMDLKINKLLEKNNQIDQYMDE